MGAAEGELEMSGKILEAKLVISGTDATGPAFKEIESKISKLAATANTVSKVSSAISGVGRQVNEAATGVDSMARSFGTVSLQISKVERQVGVLGRAMNGLGSIAKSTGALVGGALAFKGIDEAIKGVKSAGSAAHERAKLATALNVSPSDLANVDKAASVLPSKYHGITPGDVYSSYAEGRSVYAHPGDALENLETIVRTKAALRNLGQDESSVKFAVKASEDLGRANDPARNREFLDAFVRSQEVSAGTSSPEDVFEFAKMAKTAALQLSDRFLNTTVHKLIQDIGGAQAGTGLYQASQITEGPGLANNHVRAKEWARLGLVSHDDLEFNKVGDVKGLKAGRGVQGWRKADQSPDKFLYENLIPAMEKSGITNPEDQVAELNRLYTSRAASVFAKMLNQRTAIEQTTANMDRSGGTQGALDLAKTDPTAALTNALTALETAIATQLTPLIGPFTAACNRFADFIGSYSKAQADFNAAHPGLAPYTAAAQTAAEGAAAAVISGKILGAGLRSIGMGGAVDAASGAAGGFLGKIGRGLAAGAGYAASPTFLLAGAALAASTTPASAAEDERARQRRFSLPTIASGALPGLGGGPVTARLDGQASINVALSIDAPPELLAILRSGVTTSAIGDLRPDTGVSMPEAGPSQGGRNGASR